MNRIESNRIESNRIALDDDRAANRTRVADERGELHRSFDAARARSASTGERD
jgi:hypothetical protein